MHKKAEISYIYTMRLVIQRVREAAVHVEGELVSSIKAGMMVLLGIETEDNEDDVQYLVNKLLKMRIFSDKDGNMNLSIAEIEGEIIIVSQFTLHATTRKGNRPSFIREAKGEQAVEIYQRFVSVVNDQYAGRCKTGLFGANMQLTLINDGPVTIIIDSKQKNSSIYT